MIGALLAALLSAAPAEAAAPFAPPLDRPVRYTIRETTSNGGTPHTYIVSRTVTYRRDGDGFIAEATTTDARAEPADVKAAMFVAGNQAFVGHPLRIRLDRSGRVVEVIDRQREWDRWLARLGSAMKRTDAAAFARIARFVEALRAAPPAEQTESLGAHAARIVGTELVARGPTPAIPVRLPAAAPATGELLGSERIERRADGLLQYERRADGDMGQGRTARTSLSRTVDPRTGLVHAMRETSRYTLAGRVLDSDRATILDK